jgi:uncharacterized protein YutE (UPF0331/DUF86 family)
VIDLCAHWIADSRELAGRLASAAGLRNLLVHRYGSVDWARVHEIARTDLRDLDEFCSVLSASI